MDPLPFWVTASAVKGSSFRETRYEGLVRLEDGALVMEYRERVTEYGADGMEERDAGVREVRIPAQAIRSVDHHRRPIRGPVLDIELGRLGPAEELPWVTGTRIRLRVSRKARTAAAELATDFRLLRADARLRELGEGDLAE